MWKKNCYKNCCLATGFGRFLHQHVKAGEDLDVILCLQGQNWSLSLILTYNTRFLLFTSQLLFEDRLLPIMNVHKYEMYFHGESISRVVNVTHERWTVFYVCLKLLV